MDRLLQGIVLGGGAAIVLIGLTHVALGHSWIPDNVTVNASIDSEHRFYTATFAMFGAALVWCGIDIDRRRPTLHVLLLTLFVGGLARIASVVAKGWPHWFYIVLGVLELVVPPVIWAISRVAPQPHESEGPARTRMTG